MGGGAPGTSRRGRGALSRRSRLRAREEVRANSPLELLVCVTRLSLESRLESRLAFESRLPLECRLAIAASDERGIVAAKVGQVSSDLAAKGAPSPAGLVAKVAGGIGVLKLDCETAGPRNGEGTLGIRCGDARPLSGEAGREAGCE